MAHRKSRDLGSTDNSLGFREKESFAGPGKGPEGGGENVPYGSHRSCGTAVRS